MVRTSSPLKRWGHVLLLTGIGFIGLTDRVLAQATYDPYQPYNADYVQSSYPTMPNNIALPNAVREVDDYANPYGSISRYNTFQSYLNNEDGVSTRGGIGVPYFQSSRSFDSAYSRGYMPNREADRRFEVYEAERNRRYQAAMREKDPAKRAAMLQAVSRMQMPRTTAPRTLEAPRTMKPATPPPMDRREQIAAEALSRADASAAAPATTNSAVSGRVPDVRLPAISPLDPRSPNYRRSGVTVPSTRPRLPEEN